MDTPLAHAELLEVEGPFWVLTAPAGIANYDFRFDAFLRCRRPWQPPGEVQAVARVGAFSNYDAIYKGLQADGITLINTPQEYQRASELPGWYPLLGDLTPKSMWTKDRPDPAAVGSELGWPIFMKGTRQTSGHRRSLSIIAGPEQFQRALDSYAADPMLRWQGIACREFVRLRLVEEAAGDQLLSAFEFRTFWWKGTLVGCGRYWWEGRAYRATESETRAGVAIAQEAARRLNVPFLVVDIAHWPSRKGLPTPPGRPLRWWYEHQAAIPE